MQNGSVQQALDGLRKPNGLYVASPSATYNYVWIRDNCYIALADLDRCRERFEQTYYSLFDIFRKHEWKLSYHAVHKPAAVYQYIHPRYHADTLAEVGEPWGNAQNDAIGAFLFGVGEGLRRGYAMLRDETDARIVSLLIDYLQTLEYWRDEDNGMWEETRERHSSSIGACTAGLLAVQPFFEMDCSLPRNGLHALIDLLPRESAHKPCDLALLSLIYPYRLLPRPLAATIVAQVEGQLLRDLGVIRYAQDRYFGEDGQEAQWCMGLPWLGLCHLVLESRDAARMYVDRTAQVMTPGGVIPELYLARQRVPNENAPLGWAQALYLVLNHQLSPASQL